jgi:hypothetical protein
MSTRSIQKPRQTDTGSVITDVAKQHAAAAASRAMRSSQSSSQESGASRAPYDRLGGPANIAVPRRRPGSSLQCTDDSASISHGDVPTFSVSSQSKRVIKPVAHGNLVDDSAVLPPIIEFKGLDGRDSSVPSSYRRLRKARSMFATRQRTSRTPYNVSLLPCNDPADPERSPGFLMPRTMRRSMSFLRGSSQMQQSDINVGAHEAAVQLAHGQFAKEPVHTGTQHRRPSFLVKRKKEHKPFRKSFRAASEVVPPLTKEYTGRSHFTSRSISSSIKHGLKRVFRFSKAVEQQPESQNGSNCAELCVVTPINPNVETYLPREDSTTERCTIANSFRKVSQSPSRDSLCTSKSRVTSWADSTMENTLVTRKPGHRQSLSLISEDGNLDQRTPRTPAMVDVENRFSSALGSNSRRVGIVDSQDLYYALMEQMRHNTLSDSSEAMVFGAVPKHRVIPQPSKSNYSQRSRRTIRHGPSMESSISPGSFTTARCGDQSSPYGRHPRSAKYMQASRGISTQATNQNMLPCLDRKSPRSAFVAYGDSDEENDSVIIARFHDSRGDVISPSLYSRTTGGNTPNKADNTDFLDMSPHDEPGTATIFAPQRTAYSSPKHPAPALPSRLHVNPSADWQKWMSTQIDRIDQASPTREHIREDAQFQDDDEYLTKITRQAAVAAPTPPDGLISTAGSNGHTERSISLEKRLPTQSNFSRLFGQVSTIQPILPLQTVKLAIPLPNNLAKASNGLSVDSNENISPKPVSIARTQGLSPIRLRSGNMQPPESPTPKRVATKQSWTKEQQRRYSARRAPIGQDGRASQFRSMRSQLDHGENSENRRQQDEYDDMMESYHQLQDIHSTISSKRMVDIFLDSRRRQMGEPMDKKTTTEAFL